ncbi:alpha-L-rhamnosidase [Actinacidiphila alni]|uniref:alpha-L-rhamnosidase n=1 Tax=Actinacidiphila alni TaxID=380248 RepID=A0A1I2H7E9_9ACTN|nr:family 78 glycoside hydrolase catalytic domain [Actinacidiphila alni]SFF25508.1 alpha-L-rhamnosidase [Actinacidiphila alni]
MGTTPEQPRSPFSRREFVAIAVGTGVAVTGLPLVPAQAASTAASGPPRPTTLTVESADGPLGIDVTAPRLGWQLDAGGRRGLRQRSYRVLVASSTESLARDRADVWDSGQVTSADSVGVVYAGPPLRSRTRYVWKVRVWDQDGRASQWSAPSLWETGLLSPDDWTGRWIGNATSPLLTFEGAHWIWYPEGDPTQSLPPMVRSFRLHFDVPADRHVTRARVVMTADDSFVLYANGQEAGGTPEGALWYDGQVIDVTSALTTGGNTLAVAATNALDTNGNPSPAGLLGRLIVEFDSGDPLIVPTGAAWRAAQDQPAGWQQPGFDDSGWPAARETAAYGSGPWGHGVSLPPAPAPLLRRDFTVTKPVRQARLYAAGVGYHELEINGRKVGDSVLDPAPTDYDKRVLYVTHDVTQHLRRGRNAIGAELGRGFFGLRTVTAWDWTNAPWNGDPRLRLQLEIGYADGTHDIVATDDGWRTTDGPTRSDSIYAGETYDARQAQPGWSKPGFEDTAWSAATAMSAPAGRLVAQPLQPIRIKETFSPVAVTEPQPGVRVFDLGRTLGGWAALRVSGPRGTRVTLKYAQQLTADGTVDLSQGYVSGGRFQQDEYVLSGDGVETWHARFSHKSFRYVQVTGLPGAPRKDTLRGQEVRSDLATTGGFSSSSDLYARIHAMVGRSLGHHLLGIPAVDVMYEKIGWTADAQLNVPSMTFNYDTRRFLAKWLDDLADSQLDSGTIPVIAPTGGWGDDWQAPEWKAAYPIVMWELYRRFGDLRALSDHYAGVLRYVDWEYGNRDAEGLATSGLGDWLSPGGYTQPPEDTRLTATAYLHRGLSILADAAGILGRSADAARLQKQADGLRDLFNTTFLDRDRALYRTSKDPGYRQCSNAIALAFGLVPDDLRSRVADSLAADVHAHGDHLNTGAVGTAVLLPVLTATGHADVAHAAAGQRTFPSWGFWLANGADTLWETWELQQDGQGRPPSHDHYLFGSIDQWFYEQVGGITPGAPGYERITVQPSVAGPLDHAAAWVDTVRGRVAVSWRKHPKGLLTLTVDVPGNATADVHVPGADGRAVLEGGRPAEKASGVRALGGGVYRVGSGHYEFSVRTA